MNMEIFILNIKNGFLKPKKDKDGYLRIILRTQQGMKEFGIAKLVAYHFIGEPPNYIKDVTVDHINGIKTDNYYKNLRWLERSENSSIRKERAKSLGELNHEAKLKEQDVIKICNLIMENSKTFCEIGKIFGVSKYTISNIKRKANWKHITEKYNFPNINVIRDEKGKFCRN